MKKHEKRIQLRGDIYLIISVYKTPFASGTITESAQISRIESKQYNGVAYEVSTSVHGIANSNVHYAMAPCARVTQAALAKALDGLLTHEIMLTERAKERLPAIAAEFTL